MDLAQAARSAGYARARRRHDHIPSLGRRASMAVEVPIASVPAAADIAWMQQAFDNRIAVVEAVKRVISKR
jgi:hypothetical protein